MSGNKCLRWVPEVRRRELPGSVAPRAALGLSKLGGRSPEREASPSLLHLLESARPGLCHLPRGPQ
ncbi:hypothetical protein I79_023709 [Cricetulus griseus]|uniref:Uncharacterized protein n=1 Tax=Cricetulus griseus TaxID=10029 RepID=G3IIN6_CRIGR|nr:hypothetical protein I79_023709 [Cricetulus griseus]